VTQIGDTQIGGTRLVTLIATKFAGGTDICYAAANQITTTFTNQNYSLSKSQFNPKLKSSSTKKFQIKLFKQEKKIILNQNRLLKKFQFEPNPFSLLFHPYLPLLANSFTLKSC